MVCAKSFFAGGQKFNFTCVKNKYNYEGKYFECTFGCRVHNISGHATIPDMSAHITLTHKDAIMHSGAWLLKTNT